jgi:hypothetical protein
VGGCAANPQKLGAVCLDLFAPNTDGGNRGAAVFVHGAASIVRRATHPFDRVKSRERLANKVPVFSPFFSQFRASFCSQTCIESPMIMRIFPQGPT